ncbi:7694_t:CDS:2 [Cetraspora pellucida]|uniref:7694_t:CDS:1 n=1 Tax=Cetraspora pellucida TaxID=1433469 RepID=A0A9N9JZW7_9GLOM|nr:7694_t:CDS:2 [Cetraspora pellucida]
MSLSPSSVGSFASREDLINHVKTHAFNHGYAVSTKRSEKDKFVYLKYDRALWKKMEDGQWRLTIKNANQNHEASEDISGHSSSHRLNKDDQKKVQEMSIAGIYPHEILSTFRQSNSDSLAISKTIYNARDKVRHDNLQGCTPIQVLLDELIEGNFEYDYQYDQNCTYKTNKFKMPLLHVVGITNFNTTFFSCFAFLKSEQKEDYNWALTRVAYIFGDISKFQGEWSIFFESWSTLIKSKTEPDFENNWKKLKKKYNEKTAVIAYLQDTWLPFKTHFVYSWVDRYLHLGNLMTLRVEGAHAALKRYLQVSVSNLHAVHKKISLALENRYQKIKTMISQEIIRIPQAQNKPFYAQVVTKVSTFALKKVHEQFLKASSVTSENPLQPCSGAFKSSMGHPVGAKNHPQSSTKRDLSTFELVIKKQRKCGLCHGTRHNSRTCPNAESESSKSSQRKCGLCHEIGHNNRMCPNAESESSDSS